MILMRICLHSHPHSHSHSHTLTITCTFCYDEIKEIQDLKIFSHAHLWFSLHSTFYRHRFRSDTATDIIGTSSPQLLLCFISQLSGTSLWKCICMYLSRSPLSDCRLAAWDAHSGFLDSKGMDFTAQSDYVKARRWEYVMFGFLAQVLPSWILNEWCSYS